MTTANDIKLEELKIELQKTGMLRDKAMHGYKMEQLNLRKEIAKLYRSKKKK